MRQTYRDLLEDEGYDVVTAENGAEGLAKLDDLEPEPTLVVLDLSMPVMRGEDMLACLRSRQGSEDLAVVVVTGHRRAAGSADLRGVPVVRKPFDIAVFSALIRELDSDHVTAPPRGT